MDPIYHLRYKLSNLRGNFKDSDFSTHVATHFNADDHSLSDFSFMPIDIVPDDMERLLKETC